MAKRTAQKKKRVGFTAANRRKPVPRGDAVTLGRADLLILLGLAAMIFAVYAQVIGHQFITLDDDAYITENAMVNRGVTLAGVAWAFTTFYQGNWHPLTWIAHMIDSQLFGMNAGGHLLVNALMHAANTLLVFWFLFRTTHARWPSALVAALFALHPLHVESVAWAAERKDTLSTFFGLLSLIAYARYAGAPSKGRYAWTVITLALGLLAKPMLVTWPFVMLLLDYWPLRRFDFTSRKEVGSKLGPLLREKLPLFALVAASAVITTIAQSRGGAVRTFQEFPIALRLVNAVVSYVKYLLLAFWPNDLAVYYPYTTSGTPAWQIICAAFLLIGITVLCFFQPRKHSGYLVVGWLWFLGTLVPVIGIVQVGGQTMADRYFYIPSIGLFIVIAFGLADIARSWRLAPSLRTGIAVAVLLILATLTNAQIHRWSDSFTLFKHTLAVTPPNLIIENNLGSALSRSGLHDEAGAHFEKALEIMPAHYDSLAYDALLNMGITRFYQNRLAEAIEYCQSALRVRPDAPKAHDLLGMALAMQGHGEAALDEMRHAAELAPNDADIQKDIGVTLARLGRTPEAIDHFHEALRLNPYNASAHNNLGLSLLESGKARESVPEFEAALRINPELQGTADNLRRAQAQLSSQR
ncbi:MAG TPA: tetratricopeptide repeat protein [Candidatus Udaeobacter sp.]|nr:tetratricopeptide repeat protein [Candidatus Udaeobacter sp.]